MVAKVTQAPAMANAASSPCSGTDVAASTGDCGASDTTSGVFKAPKTETNSWVDTPIGSHST
jgi:hypothetical protein